MIPAAKAPRTSPRPLALVGTMDTTENIAINTRTDANFLNMIIIPFL